LFKILQLQLVHAANAQVVHNVYRITQYRGPAWSTVVAPVGIKLTV